MGLHKTSDEKLMLINEFFDSHLSIRQFCSKRIYLLLRFRHGLDYIMLLLILKKNDDNNEVFLEYCTV